MICFLRRARACLATECLVLAVGTPAIGQTLKATAPVLTSPATGAQLDTRRPALTVSNAVGIFVPAIFNYRFQIFLAEDPEVVVVSAVVPHTNGHTVFTPPADLEFETTYVWSARAELDGAVGPESTSFSFRTPAAPPPIGPLGFTNVSAASGVAVQILGGHGAMFADATGDLGPDLYITMNFNDPVAELFLSIKAQEPSRKPERFVASLILMSARTGPPLQTSTMTGTTTSSMARQVRAVRRTTSLSTLALASSTT